MLDERERQNALAQQFENLKDCLRVTRLLSRLENRTFAHRAASVKEGSELPFAAPNPKVSSAD